MKAVDEPNPALGWRAVRIGLDRPGMMRMQLQALVRAAAGRPLSVMFPFVAQREEFTAARAEMDKALERERILGHPLPASLEVGVMLETPSLAFAPDGFYREVDFLSIGGNDLKQFFFAADRENELVRRRYDTLNVSFLTFLEGIVERCDRLGTPLSFCGEDAGRPVEAACLAAIGLQHPVDAPRLDRAGQVDPAAHRYSELKLGAVIRRTKCAMTCKPPPPACSRFSAAWYP